ncbi:gem-associated protein 2-like [Xenia sp. Carnegie-2017]|uniref:gem-associated protein 2-like n=1 Tax=Xenia sp. Carnegie-2017 TaxID=2897299 RepID=UPI001F048303|nr:gem-associated protein 2-like [Xenia sp. Carnegie-2017]
MEAVFRLEHLKNTGKKNSNSNPTGFPTSAYDYLKSVQHEASNCPDIVVADMDCSIFQANQDHNFMLVEPVNTSGLSVLWQNEQVSAFSEIRQFLAHQKLLFVKKNIEKRKLPDPQNSEQWLKFCFGQTTQESFSSNENNENNGCPAFLGIICQMNQTLVLKVLDHHIHWMESRPFTMLQGQWIYALLIAVEKPLLPDTTYALRMLARLCSKQKNSLAIGQTDEMAALCLIITLVMGYFGQSDLGAEH